MKRLPVFFILTFCPLLLMAQEHQVQLKRQVMHPVQMKSMAALAMYRYSNDSIYPSLDPLTKRKGAPFQIQLPVMEGVDDTAFGFLFFGGKETTINRGFVLVMVNNYNSRKPQLVYVDHNFNEDLSDDGPPLLFDYKQDSIEFELQSNKPGAGKVRYRISRFQLLNKKSFRDFMNSYYSENSTNPGYLGIEKAYRIQSFNILAGEFQSGKDSFTLALWDANNDGIYNESGEDRLITGMYATTALPADEQLDVYELNSGEIFEWNLKPYRFLAADQQGTWVRFGGTDTSLQKVLPLHKKIPRAFAKDLAGKQVKLRKLSRRKPSYFFFYNFSNPGISTDTAYLGLLQREYGHHYNIVGINYADRPQDLDFARQYWGASWIHLVANRKLLQQFYVQSLPMGFSVHKRGRLHQVGVSPQAFYEQLKAVPKQ